MSKEKIGRIASRKWSEQRPQALAIFHGGYDEDGELYKIADPKPWTVIGGNAAIYEEFTTHAEALAWAFEKAEAGA